MNIKDLLDNLEQGDIESLFPYDSYSLIVSLNKQLQEIESKYTKLLEIITPAELLLNKESRKILLGVMKEKDIKACLEAVGRPNLTDPYLAIKDLAFNLKESEKEAFLKFFGLELPPSKAITVSEETSTHIEVIPQYSLFTHQRNALLKLEKLLIDSGRALLHMPTGSGKTRTAMALVCRYLQQHENGLVIWLADTIELCEQAYAEFNRSWTNLGDRSINAYCITKGRIELLSEINSGFVVISLQTGNSALRIEAESNVPYIRNLAYQYPFVIFDEAHKAVAPTYKELTNRLVPERGLKGWVLGLSATPGRSTDDPDADLELVRFFQRNIVSLDVDGYSSPIEYLVDQGYMAEAKFISVHSRFDCSIFNETLKGNGNNELDPVDQKKLEMMVSNDLERNILICQTILDISKRHSRIIVFAASVEQSRRLSYVLNSYGFKTKSLTTADGEDRKAVINWFKESRAKHPEVRILFNYGILTTGFDAPETSAAVIARPTNSLVLYAQMVGRALRGEKAGGNKTAEIATIIDKGLPKFWNVESFFRNWDGRWKK